MSFDISIRVAPGSVEEDPEYFEVGNYTYNCNPMVAHALKVVGVDAGNGSIREVMRLDPAPQGGSGLFRFRNAPCVEAAGLLSALVGEMSNNPEVYRAMNPENGWGDYDSFLDYLTSLLVTCIEHPTGKIVIS